MILRILLISVVTCAAAVAIFYLYSTGVPKIINELTIKGKMENTIWVVENFIPMICILGLVAVLCIIYRIIKVESWQMHTEKGWIMLICAAFTYGVILPYVINASGSFFAPEAEDAVEVATLLENTASWFVIQIIPFMLILSYHFTMAAKKVSASDGESAQTQPDKEKQEDEE